VGRASQPVSSTSPVYPAPESPPRPLEQANFSGTYVPGDPVRNGGQATYDGHVFTVMLPTADVASVLPSGFELAPRKISAADHPVVCMLGFQRACKFVVFGQPLPSGQGDYEELIVIVPYVVRSGGQGLWHNFAVRMFLSEPAPVFVGDVIYEYSKGLGRFVQTAGGELVIEDQGPDVFECRVQPTSAPVPAAQAMPGFDDFMQLMKMPILGIEYPPLQLPPPLPPLPPTQCSYFEWEGSAASVGEIDGAVRFSSEFRPGMASWIKQAPNWTGARADSSFGVSGIRWRLADLPVGCTF